MVRMYTAHTAYQIYRGNTEETMCSMEKKLIAFRCPADLLAEIDATCGKYALDRTAYITLAIRHMEDLLERRLGFSKHSLNSDRKTTETVS